jgi:winged helix-turn-helix protein DUF2582
LGSANTAFVRSLGVVLDFAYSPVVNSRRVIIESNALAVDAAIVRAKMHGEIGTTAGAIWQALNAKGELSLPSLKQQVEAKSPIFDWAIGWLAREDKLIITRHQRSYRVRLNDAQAWRAGA